MSKTAHGVQSVRYNGEIYEVKSPVEYAPGGMMQEPEYGQTGLAGFKESPAEAFIEFTGVDGPNVNLADLQASRDGTASFVMRNGKTFTLSGASYVGAAKASSESGEIPMKFVGEFGIES